MTFKKIEELTVLEALALTFVEFRLDRFTSNKLATRLCALLGAPFKVRALTAVEKILEAAALDGLVEAHPGPRGGTGYRISDSGARLVQDVQLPPEIFLRRESLDGERDMEAKENPGPMLERLLALVQGADARAWRDRNFAVALSEYWLKQGWLSRKQCDSAAEIASRHGVFIQALDYVGMSTDAWLRPYRDAILRREAEAHARARELAAEREAVRRESERLKAQVRDANREVRRVLDEMEAAGRLVGLDALVAAVFPETTVSKAAKASAFAGAGSKCLRACVAALAFGMPPSLVWQGRKGVVQPGPDSEVWMALTNHPAHRELAAAHPVPA